MGTDVDGVLWLFSLEGALLSLQGAKLVAPNIGPVDNLPSLVKDKNGELWVVRGSLLGTLKKGRWRRGSPMHNQTPMMFKGLVPAGMEACGLWVAGG